MAQQPPPNPKRRSSSQPPLPDWRSGLPEDLLRSIAQRLASGHDAASFRSACSPWRAAVPFATSFGPLLLLPLDPGSDRVAFYCVSEQKLLFSTPLPDVRGKVPCGSSCGWLALMDEAASVTLLNPFAGADARAPRVELPPAGEHVAAASSSDPVSKVDGRWFLRSAGGIQAGGRAIGLEDMRDVFFREIVLSAPPDAAAGECVAMAMLGCSTEVAFCRVGVDSAWTLLDTKLELSVAAVVHCQGKFLAIDHTGEISVVVCSSSNGAGGGGTPTATLLPSLSPPAGLCHRSYLESHGELHVVGATVSTFHETLSFAYRSAIYKCNLDDRTPEWSRVKDIGDQTLFVSKHFGGSSFSGTSVARYKENKIYMSEPLYGDPYDLVHRLEIVDIATGASQVKPVHEKMQGSEALGWIRPNLWKGGGFSKDKEKSQTEATSNVTGSPEPAAEIKSSAVQSKST